MRIAASSNISSSMRRQRVMPHWRRGRLGGARTPIFKRRCGVISRRTSTCSWATEPACRGRREGRLQTTTWDDCPWIQIRKTSLGGSSGQRGGLCCSMTRIVRSADLTWIQPCMTIRWGLIPSVSDSRSLTGRVTAGSSARALAHTSRRRIQHPRMKGVTQLHQQSRCSKQRGVHRCPQSRGSGLRARKCRRRASH